METQPTYRGLLLPHVHGILGDVYLWEGSSIPKVLQRPWDPSLSHAIGRWLTLHYWLRQLWDKGVGGGRVCEMCMCVCRAGDGEGGQHVQLLNSQDVNLVNLRQ